MLTRHTQVIDNIKLIGTEKIFTPRVVAEMFALGGSGPRPVGTPEMVADFFEKWWREGGIDGYNLNCNSLSHPHLSSLPLSPFLIQQKQKEKAKKKKRLLMQRGDIDVTSPGSFEDIVNLLIPELQKRGIYWTDYPAPGGTARENLHRVPGKPLLPETHPGIKIELNGGKVEA